MPCTQAACLADELLQLPGPSAPASVAAAAARQLATLPAGGGGASGILTPLLSVSSAVDAGALLRVPPATLFSAFAGAAGGDSGGGSGGGVSSSAAGMSPAACLFTCLRSYPRNAGEVDGAKRLLEALLCRVADAAAQVAKRLAGLKVRRGAAQSERMHAA